MNPSRRKVHLPSYVLGVTTGVVLACLGCLLIGLHFKRSLEYEQIEQQTLKELQAIDGLGKQSTLDHLANTYAHLRMGLYKDPTKLLTLIEESARKHEDLAREIEKRRHFWERKN